MLTFGSIWVYAVGLLLVVLIILLRIPTVALFVGISVPKPEKSIMSVMTPKGLVPAVLASLPLQRGLNNGEIILDLGYSIVLFSIVICSVLVIILSIKPNIFIKRTTETDKLSEAKPVKNDFAELKQE